MRDLAGIQHQNLAAEVKARAEKLPHTDYHALIKRWHSRLINPKDHHFHHDVPPVVGVPWYELRSDTLTAIDNEITHYNEED